MKLNARAFALASAIIWALGVLIAGLLAAYLDWGTPIIKLMGTCYIGYAPTLVGSLIGAVWGFFDALIGCYAFAWLYNKLCGSGMPQKKPMAPPASPGMPS